MSERKIQEELEKEIAAGRGCMVFDIACYFPYLNPEKKFTFEFSVNGENPKDVVLNHRYPNKKYYTISQKTGHKLSKIGYPLFVDLNEDTLSTFLQITIGYDDDVVHLVFPLNVELTKECPVCGLSLRFDLDKKTLHIVSHRRMEKEKEWKSFRWQNFPKHMEKDNGICVLAKPDQIGNTLIYEEQLTPFPQRLEELLV